MLDNAILTDLKSSISSEKLSSLEKLCLERELSEIPVLRHLSLNPNALSGRIMHKHNLLKSTSPICELVTTGTGISVGALFREDAVSQKLFLDISDGRSFSIDGYPDALVLIAAMCSVLGDAKIAQSFITIEAPNIEVVEGFKNINWNFFRQCRPLFDGLPDSALRDLQNYCDEGAAGPPGGEEPPSGGPCLCWVGGKCPRDPDRYHEKTCQYRYAYCVGTCDV